MCISDEEKLAEGKGLASLLAIFIATQFFFSFCLFALLNSCLVVSIGLFMVVFVVSVTIFCPYKIYNIISLLLNQERTPADSLHTYTQQQQQSNPGQDNNII